MNNTLLLFLVIGLFFERIWCFFPTEVEIRTDELPESMVASGKFPLPLQLPQEEEKDTSSSAFEQQEIESVLANSYCNTCTVSSPYLGTCGDYGSLSNSFCSYIPSTGSYECVNDFYCNTAVACSTNADCGVNQVCGNSNCGTTCETLCQAPTPTLFPTKLPTVSQSGESCSYFGIVKELSLTSLTSAGWVKCYDVTYATATTTSSLQTACSNAASSMLLVGSMTSSSASTISLGAYISAAEFLAPTYSNVVADYKNGAYWYNYGTSSIGFADVATISLNSADTTTGDSRLSWHTDGYNGGYRSGNTISLNSDTNWRKIIWKKECTASPSSSATPTRIPTRIPTAQPTRTPTAQPSRLPTVQPTKTPTTQQTNSVLDCSVSGIDIDVSISNLEGNGWVKCYDEPYSAYTTVSGLQSSCNADSSTMLMVGSKSSTSATTISLGGFIQASDFFAKTYSTSTAEYKNGAYWYNYYSDSIGFADSATVNLYSADIVSGDKRLSWHTSGAAGGYRSGNSVNLNYDGVWRKVIYQKASCGSPTPVPVVCSDATNGIIQNYPVATLATNGWSKCYDVTYSTLTSTSSIQAACGNSASSVLIVSSMTSSSSSTLSLGAYITAADFLTPTYSTTVAEYKNGAYWYNYAGKSIGFADSSTISLSSADTLTGERRLSWHTDNYSGGYRSGNSLGLNSDNNWRKTIWKKDCIPSSISPLLQPTIIPSRQPTVQPTRTPTAHPTDFPTRLPTSTALDCSASGIRNDFGISSLDNNGWVKCYDVTYSTATTVDSLREGCNADSSTLLMVGSKTSTSSSSISLGGFVKASDFFTQTYSTVVAEYKNGAYWYNYNHYSIGFADSSTINLNSADTMSGEMRLSWHTSGSVGGYRSGNTLSLNSDTIWRKVVYQKPCNGEVIVPTPAPTPAVCSDYSGIIQDYTIASLTAKGWTKCYDEPYSSPTTTATLNSACNDGSSLLLVSSMTSSSASTVKLGAFVYATDFFSETNSVSVANYHNGAYWYNYRFASIGFADTSTINLGSADTVSGDKRLSWHTDGYSGGYRSGNVLGLNSDSVWRKVVWKLDCNNIPVANPTKNPTKRPTAYPTVRPTRRPTSLPTSKPTRFQSFGIIQNFPISNLLADGWVACYNEEYSMTTAAASLRAQCGVDGSMLMMGSQFGSGSSTVSLGAFIPSSELFTETSSNWVAEYHNGAYWYNVPYASIGFADTSSISLSIADTMYGDQRLSWHINEVSGGYRSGNNMALNDDTTWRKIIYKKVESPCDYCTDYQDCVKDVCTDRLSNGCYEEYPFPCCDDSMCCTYDTDSCPADSVNRGSSSDALNSGSEGTTANSATLIIAIVCGVVVLCICCCLVAVIAWFIQSKQKARREEAYAVGANVPPLPPKDIELATLPVQPPQQYENPPSYNPNAAVDAKIYGAGVGGVELSSIPVYVEEEKDHASGVLAYPTSHSQHGVAYVVPSAPSYEEALAMATVSREEQL